MGMLPLSLSWDKGMWLGEGRSLGTRPLKNRKEGLVNGVGWKCTLRNVRNFTRLVLQRSKMKQNAKMVLVQLAFLVNPHQNANQKPIRSVSAYWAQCTLPPQPIYQTLLSIFKGLVPRLGEEGGEWIGVEC